MTATAWKPPPERRGYANAEEQHEFSTVCSRAADWLEEQGSSVDWTVFTAGDVIAWRKLAGGDDEVYELRCGDGGPVWRVTGSVCCDRCGWKVSRVVRVEA